MTPETTDPYTFHRAPLDKLSVDPRYQREAANDTSRRLINKIAKGFNWCHFGAPIVTSDGNGGFTVIDGQHRIEAARKVGAITHVPVLEIDAETLKEQAHAFSAINRDRVKVSAAAIFHADCAGGDQAALEIRETLAGYDLKVPRANRSASQCRQGEISCVGALRKIHKNIGNERLDETIAILTAAWDDQINYQRPVIQALALLGGLGDELDAERLITVLADTSADDLQRRGRAYREVHRGPLVNAIVEVILADYNKGLLQRNRLTLGASS